MALTAGFLSNADPMIGTAAAAGRAAAFLFDGFWISNPLDYFGNVVAGDIPDSTWPSWENYLGGPPTGEVFVSNGQPGGPGLHSYERRFASGHGIAVILDPTETGLAQIAFAGTVV